MPLLVEDPLMIVLVCAIELSEMIVKNTNENTVTKASENVFC